MFYFLIKSSFAFFMLRTQRLFCKRRIQPIWDRTLKNSSDGPGLSRGSNWLPLPMHIWWVQSGLHWSQGLELLWHGNHLRVSEHHRSERILHLPLWLPCLGLWRHPWSLCRLLLCHVLGCCAVFNHSGLSEEKMTLIQSIFALSEYRCLISFA